MLFSGSPEIGHTVLQTFWNALRLPSLINISPLKVYNETMPSDPNTQKT